MNAFRDDSSELSFEAQLELERLAEQFEANWRRNGQEASISVMLKAAKPEHQERLFRTLLEIDLYCRKRAGESPQVEAYTDAFPKYKQAIRGIVSEFVADDTPPIEGRPTIQEGPGSVIGRYKLLQQIGEGGFGVVYMAEQNEPVRRRVALKIIKPGMDTKEVIARFEAERQALALMDHPNIAKVLDGGATQTGRPFFVMELVKGLPITKFCDDNNLDVAARLSLFTTVCQAVQHAHQKGVIHRDIKPSNVLVTLRDGQPLSKVIDFGVAKAISQQLTEKTLFTVFGQMVGTPQYMSPEQADISAVDVDTRGDVYSLGVLLYELLTGATPIDATRLRTACYAEVQRLIREEEPQKPSTRVSSSAEELRTLARHRNVSTDRLPSLIRGDLDWIVMKAIEKDRSRRYDTSAAFADDIYRYLGDEPVQARPTSVSYRAWKFARRNRQAVSIVGCIGVLVIIGFAMIGQSWRQAEHLATQRRIEQYVSDMNLAGQALAEGNITRARLILGRYESQGNEEDIRDFAWWKLWRECHSSQARSTFEMPYGIRRVRFTRDGARLALSLADGRTLIYRCGVQNARPMLTKLAHIGTPYRYLWYPNQTGWHLDGKRVVLLSEDHESAFLYDVDAKNNGPEFEHKGPIKMIDLSPDGKLIACAGEKNLAVWDIPSQQPIREAHEDYQTTAGSLSGAIAFSPDSQWIAWGSGMDGRLRLWNLRSDEEPRQSKAFQLIDDQGATHVLTACRFSPDGRSILVGYEDGTIRVFDSLSLEVVRHFLGHNDGVREFSFSPDGKLLATCSRNNTIHVWEWPNCRRTKALRGHDSAVGSVQFHPNGKYLVSGSADGKVKFWDISEPTEEFGEIELPSTAIYVGQSESASGFYIGWSGGVMHWDAATDSRSYSDTSSSATDSAAVVVSRDGAIVRLDRSDRLCRHPFGSPNVTCTESPHVVPLEISHEQELLAVQLPDGTGEIWDSVALERKFALPTRLLDVHYTTPSAAFSHDGSLCALANDKYEVLICSAADGSNVRSLKKHKQGVVSIAFSPMDCNCIATASWDGTAIIWDVEQQREVHVVRHAQWVGGVVFSPDGKILASVSGDQSVKLWRVDNGRQLLSIHTGFSHPRHVAFSRDGNYLAVTEKARKRVRVYRAR